MAKFEITEHYTKEEGNIILAMMPREIAVGLIMVFNMETKEDPDCFAQVLNYVCSDPVGIACDLKSEYDAALLFAKENW